MAKNPGPLVVIQDLNDELEEALDRHDETRARQLRRELRRRLAEQALRDAAAQSLARNGMSERTRDLLRDLGYRVVPVQA